MKINTFIGDNRILDNLNRLNSQKLQETEKSEGKSFLSALKEQLNEVNEKQLVSEAASEAFIKGENIDIHQVMLVTEEAKLSLQVAVQVRNKLVEAYQELNRMQL